MIVGHPLNRDVRLHSLPQSWLDALDSPYPALDFTGRNIILATMQTGALSRRRFIADSVVVTAPLLTAAGAIPLNAAEGAMKRVLNVVCVGGHSDDPESGCAGTLARYAQLGHSVTVIYLTRGERGIRDKGLDDSARIRSAESETACKIMGAKAMFFGQIDGATEITRAHVEAMTKLLSTEKPSLIGPSTRTWTIR